MQLLVVTTHNDPSLKRLRMGAKSAGLVDTVFYYDADPTAILRHRYDVVYFRDPFNDPEVAKSTVVRAVDAVRTSQLDSYYLDHADTFVTMLFEDKWEQYKRFADLMPATSLLHSFDQVGNSERFVKKRISSRSRGVLFTPDDAPAGAIPGDYLSQQRLDIDMEYRVFMVRGEIISPAAVKSSKTATQKSTVIGLEYLLDDRLRAICRRAYELTGYDFMGLDIARVRHEYYLLEVNRSCQFNAYYGLTGINLAEQLWRKVRTGIVG